MRIAVIGGGISGLVAAYRLQSSHTVTLLEANDYIGGHTNTVEVPCDGKLIPIDTGFIVFNDATYPNFIRLLEEWRVVSQPTQMSFSVRCDRTGMEYCGRDLNGLFAQRSNLVNGRFYRLLADFFRFGKLAKQLLQAPPTTTTVAAFLAEHKLSSEFRDWYLLPMGAAIWSCPPEKFAEFPIHFIAEFYAHHGLLDIFNRPQWRVIQGGSQTYVQKIKQNFRGQMRTKTAITAIKRLESEVRLQLNRETWESYDHVIFACHSDQALRILGDDASPQERELLSGFPYEENIAVLHTDERLLPQRKRAWGCWNYIIPAAEHKEERPQAHVTYNMNLLQTLNCSQTFLVTLNGEEAIRPEHVLRRFVYHHPVFTTRRASLQQRHRELIDYQNTSYCGAYWRNGFHEDGVVSALAVCEVLNGKGSDAQLPLSGKRVASATLAD